MTDHVREVAGDNNDQYLQRLCFHCALKYESSATMILKWFLRYAIYASISERGLKNSWEKWSHSCGRYTIL